MTKCPFQTALIRKGHYYICLNLEKTNRENEEIKMCNVYSSMGKGQKNWEF